MGKNIIRGENAWNRLPLLLIYFGLFWFKHTGCTYQADTACLVVNVSKCQLILPKITKNVKKGYFWIKNFKNIFSLFQRQNETNTFITYFNRFKTLPWLMTPKRDDFSY